MIVSTSNLVQLFHREGETRDTLSSSVGKINRKYKYGGHSTCRMQKSTENVFKSPRYRDKEIGAIIAPRNRFSVSTFLPETHK